MKNLLHKRKKIEQMNENNQHKQNILINIFCRPWCSRQTPLHFVIIYHQGWAGYMTFSLQPFTLCPFAELVYNWNTWIGRLQIRHYMVSKHAPLLNFFTESIAGMFSTSFDSLCNGTRCFGFAKKLSRNTNTLYFFVNVDIKITQSTYLKISSKP